MVWEFELERQKEFMNRSCAWGKKNPQLLLLFGKELVICNEAHFKCVHSCVQAPIKVELHLMTTV